MPTKDGHTWLFSLTHPHAQNDMVTQWHTLTKGHRMRLGDRDSTMALFWSWEGNWIEWILSCRSVPMDHTHWPVSVSLPLPPYIHIHSIFRFLQKFLHDMLLFCSDFFKHTWEGTTHVSWCANTKSAKNWNGLERLFINVLLLNFKQLKPKICHVLSGQIHFIC